MYEENEKKILKQNIKKKKTILKKLKSLFEWDEYKRDTKKI
jgi:hypothetical protein